MVEFDDPINRFNGPYRFLSNFYRHSITYQGIIYPTLEHAYQAAKTNDLNEKLMIRDCGDAAKAKKMGSPKYIAVRQDWMAVNLGIMEELLYLKFSDLKLKKLLLDTGSRLLIEGNNWGDEFWGAIWSERQRKYVGENYLGKLLMKVREKLKSEE